MNDGRPSRSFPAQVWVYIGAALFLVALLVSAILVPALRPIHAFQALIYVAVIGLTRRNSAWGYGAGFAAGMVWNGMNLLMTHLMQVGALAFWSMVRTGHVEHVVPMMVAVGGIGHFILIIAGPLAVARGNTQSKKWWKFAGGGAIALAYFFLIVAFARPH